MFVCREYNTPTQIDWQFSLGEKGKSVFEITCYVEHAFYNVRIHDLTTHIKDAHFGC